MNDRSPTAGFFHKHRTEFLMWALVAEMLSSPLADYHPRIGAFLGISVLIFLLAGLSFMADKRITRVVVVPIAGVWLIARLLEAFSDSHHWYAQLAPVAGLALSCSILWAIFDRFHSVSSVTRSAISEAFISYLIIAIAFSQLYWILNRALDQPFNQTIHVRESSTLLYFSMITLSGVGYGGIVPINPYVRLIAALESMAGVFYVAVVVARLVSSYRPTPRP